jgi:hypothetical protein
MTDLQQQPPRNPFAMTYMAKKMGGSGVE